MAEGGWFLLGWVLAGARTDRRLGGEVHSVGVVVMAMAVAHYVGLTWIPDWVPYWGPRL